ncbi:MAG: hypothetical protein Q8P77_00835 [Candidatus Veblenbacteria bacterium]|nr:hypothetical protein [Candidatus Veblenbacteria bacterium]
MSDWSTQWKSSHPIYQRISQGTKEFLTNNGQDVLKWLWDSNRLIDQFKAVTDYYDYSFAIAPAFKALEKWLLLLAPHLGVPAEVISKAQETGRLSSFLADDKVNEFFSAVLERLSVEAEVKRELRTAVQSLNSTLKNFRHSPAHCGTVIENALKAETDFFTLLNCMDTITQQLIDKRVINSGSFQVSDDYEEERARINAARVKLGQGPL